jgi:hypothetical protein
MGSISNDTRGDLRVNSWIVSNETPRTFCGFRKCAPVADRATGAEPGKQGANGMVMTN